MEISSVNDTPSSAYIEAAVLIWGEQSGIAVIASLLVAFWLKCVHKGPIYDRYPTGVEPARQIYLSSRWRYNVLKPGQTVFFDSGIIHFVFQRRGKQTLAARRRGCS